MTEEKPLTKMFGSKQQNKHERNGQGKGTRKLNAITKLEEIHRYSNA